MTRGHRFCAVTKHSNTIGDWCGWLAHSWVTTCFNSPHPTQQRFPKIPLLCLASRQMDVTHSTGSRMNGTFSGDIPAHLFPTPISSCTTSDER